jgi:hypothetical protein
MRAIASRLGECGFTMHPEKPKIVYCKDGNRAHSRSERRGTHVQKRAAPALNDKPLVQIVYLPKEGAPIALCVMKEVKPDAAVTD